MAKEWAPLLSLLASLIVLGGVAHVLIRSQRWTGPGQDVRLKHIEDEQHLIRGNVRRLETDISVWRRETMETNEVMLRELRAIGQNGAKGQPLAEKVGAVEDRLFDIEQVLATLPCAPKCPNPEREG
jgi:hypothetical protein